MYGRPDPKKVAHYLAMLKGEDREFASAVIKNTIYMPYNVLIQDIRYLIEKYLSSTTNCYMVVINFNEKEKSSDHRIYGDVVDMFSKPRYLGNITFKDNIKVDFSVDLLLIDDWICSGQMTTGKIDNFIYYNKSIKSKFYVIAPYQSYYNCIHRFAREYKVRVECLYARIIEPISEYYTGDVEAMTERFGLELEGYPIYGEHSMPGPFSSFPTIYLKGFIPELKVEFGSLLT